MQSEELKPCPFCGHSAHIEQRGDPRMSTIYQCDDCGCSLETGEERDYGVEWNRRAIASLSAAEPVAAMTTDYLGCEYVSTDVDGIEKIAAAHSKGPTEVVYLYAAPPAPSVAVKALELNGVPDALACGKGFWRTCTGCHESNEGYPTGPFSDTLKCHLGGGCFECGGIGAVWDTTDYEDMGNFIALSAQVQDTHELRTETCQRCQGNGEIVTDWERYRHPHENDVGDEAVSECPDCDGIGKVAAQVQDVAGWQLVPKQPTEEMEKAGRKEAADCDDTYGSSLFSAAEIYCAMLAAAPAKQEG